MILERENAVSQPELPCGEGTEQATALGGQSSEKVIAGKLGSSSKAGKEMT